MAWETYGNLNIPGPACLVPILGVIEAIEAPAAAGVSKMFTFW